MSVPMKTLERPFTQVDGSDVYVSYPLSSDVGDKKAPRVILLFGWMGATLPQLHKFTEMYHKLYPSATQILVRTFIKSLFAELPTNKLYVLPVVKLLHEAGIHAYDPPESSGLLVHSISNGGALAQTYLAHCLSDTRPPPTQNNNTTLPTRVKAALPAQALIYDSLPSTITFPVFLNFFSTGIPTPALRLIAKSLLIPAYIGTVAYRSTVDRRPDTFTTLRKELSDGGLVPQGVSQVYIYGGKDGLTPDWSVEVFVGGVRERLKEGKPGEGSKEGEGVGEDEIVRVEKFEESAHVSHAKNDPKRYWDAVVRTWEESCRLGGGGGGKPRCKL